MKSLSSKLFLIRLFIKRHQHFIRQYCFSLVLASVKCKKTNDRMRVLFKETTKRGNASVLPQCQKPEVVKCSFIKVNKLFKRIKKKNVGRTFLIIKGINIRLKAIL